MNIHVHDDFERIPLTRAQWNSLSRHSSTNTIFQTHEWVTAWWKTFGDNYHLHCLTADDGQGIYGLAPMMSRHSSPYDWRFLADSNSDYCDFLSLDNGYSTLDMFLRHLTQDRPEWNSLTFHNIPEQSLSLACLQTLCEKYGLRYRLGKRIAAPEIVFGEGTDSYRVKYSVRRHCSRLERLGRVEFEVVRNPDEISGLLDTLYRQHIARFRKKGERSLFENTDCRDFYSNLARELSGTGWLHFSRLMLDGIPLAVHFGFEYNQTLTWYKPAFDVEYGHYSPGTVLIKHLIDYALKHRLKVMDFTIGDESFKSRFSNAITYNRNLAIYRNRGSEHMHRLKHSVEWTTGRVMSMLWRPHVPG